MSGIIHIIGNGDNCHTFNHKDKTGRRLVCNVPPFAVENVFAACIVDFKMMFSLSNGELNLDMYKWVLGTRPKMFMEQNPSFNIQHASHIKEYYTTVPPYAQNATYFNCGHMAAHYSANRLQSEEIHMYGFDSIFDHNMNSVTDFILPSDREQNNNYRLLNVWRPIWTHLFSEFPNTKFILHHKHNNLKIPVPNNVEVYTK